MSKNDPIKAAYLFWGVVDNSDKPASLLEIAADQLRDMDIPPHAAGIISMLALSILGIIASSPEDEAERLEAIAQVARSR